MLSCMNIRLSQATLFLSQLFLFAIFIVVGTALQQLPARGYGYGECSAAAPSNLAVTTTQHGRRLHFSWDAVTFTDCTDTAVDHYRLQIRYNDGTLIQSDDDVHKTYKNITRHTLRRNHAYKFRVRAVAADDTATSWSDYKLFHTTPKAPSPLRVTGLTAHAVRVTWANVIRSQYLRYYQVLVYRGSHVIFHKKVHTGLRHKNTGAVVRRLRPGTTYTVKVRAMANQNTASKYTSQQFTTSTQ